MKIPRSQIVSLTSAPLLAPAVFLCVCGLLYSFAGMESANRLLEQIMSNSLLKVFFSPLLVLGGPILVLLLNTKELCSLTIAFEHGEWLVAFAVKRIYRHLIPLLLSGMLITLLLLYGFVENFRIVVR